MPSIFQKQSKLLPFLSSTPANKRMVNPFGLNTPIPGKINIPQEQQQQAAPFDFMKEYGNIANNRPNRMAYQEAVEQGQPQIERGKWAKLGALLAAGGTSLGQNSAEAGMRLGLSAYNEPQRKSDEAYRERIAGLGNLAQMEDSDVQMKTRMLEAQRDDWYKQSAEGRANRQMGLQEQTTQSGLETDKLQRQNLTGQIEDRFFDAIEDPNDGITYRVDRRDGTRTKIGATALTTKQQVDKDLQIAEGRAKAEAAARAPSEAADRANRLQIAQEANKSKESIATQNNATRAATAIAKLGNLAQSATGIQRQQYLDLKAAIANEPALADLPLDSIIDNTGPLMKVIDDKPGLFGLGGDAPEVAIAKEKLKEILARAGSNINIGGAGRSTTTPGNTNTGRPPLPPGWSE